MADTIENLNIEITAVAGDAAQKVKGLSDALHGLKRTASGGFARPAKDLRKDADMVERLSAKLRGVQQSATAGKNALNGVAGAMGSAAKQAAELSTGMQKAFNILDRIGETIGGTLGTIAAGGINDIITLVKHFGGKIPAAIKKATSAAKGFFHQIKRIVTYRAIRAALKFVTQEFEEGIKNLYEWSRAADGKFKASMDSISASSLYLGNSLAAMVSPLINTLAPALDYIADKIVYVFNLINALFSRLTGAASYTAAKRVSSEWKEAAKGAGGAADEMKRTLLGFDEINRLADESGGGGGGGGLDAGADMFEKRTIGGKIAAFADAVREAFNAGDWKALGTILGSKVNELIDMVNFASLGAKVGKGINSLFTTTYWTLDTINFTNIGSGIATFLSNMIKNINFSTLAGTLVKKATIIPDALIGFLRDFDWSTAGVSISNFITGLFTELTNWLNNKDWEQVGKDLGTAIRNLIKSINWLEVAKTAWNLFIAALKAIINLAIGFVEGLFGIDFSQIGKDIAAAVKKGWDAVADFFINIWANIVTTAKDLWNMLSTAWGNVRDWVVSVSAKVVTAAKTLAKNVVDGWNKLQESVRTVGLAATIKTAAKTLWNNIKRDWEVLKTTFPVLAKISNTALSIWNGLKTAWGNIRETVRSLPAYAALKTTAQDLWTTLSTAWDNLKDSPIVQVGVQLVKDGWTTLTGWIGDLTASLGISLPSISVTWDWDPILGLVKIPHFSVSWDGGTQTSDTTYNGSMFGGGREFGGGSARPGSGVGRSSAAKRVGTGSAGKFTKISANALGGIFSGGAWRNIPQFAGGGGLHGSIFWAGENGPEIVGHVGGRTEVLNKSQLASAMYAAVRSAMAPAAANYADAAMYLYNGGAAGNGGSSTLEEGIETMESMLALLRQQNAEFVQALENFRVECDGETLGRAAIRGINTYQQRTGRLAITL